MYDPHSGHRPLQPLAHPSPHNMNHNMHGNTNYHGNHVSNHVMGSGSVPDVHKRDKDAIYG